MKEIKKVPKPFQRGKCQSCHHGQGQEASGLCRSCARYVRQDYCPQRDALCSEEGWERISKKVATVPLDVPSETELADDEFGLIPKRKHVQTLFSKAGLSSQEKRIIKLIFADGLTQNTVANKLRISRNSVKVYARRCLKKLRFCHPPALLMRGKSIEAGPQIEYLGETNGSPFSTVGGEELISPENTSTHKKLPSSSRAGRVTSLLRTFCPRCEDRVFIVDCDFQYCMNCLWSSDLEKKSVEPIVFLSSSQSTQNFGKEPT
jgi:DNA-binding CsgD family transcriptional regulator